LQISSLNARLADPQKILKRLSSLSLGERFRSGAGTSFGADWELVGVSSVCSEIGERTAVVVWLLTLKPSRLVDLGCSCCFTSYSAFLRRRYFDLRNKDMALQTSSLLIPLHQAPIAARVLENQNPSNFRGMLLPPKNPNFASALDS
jgi:hypothetical protein